jgi:uncharacterized protein
VPPSPNESCGSTTRHPGVEFGLFVLLAFAWSWAFWLPSALADGDEPAAPFAAGLYGPALAALVLAAIFDGRAGIRRLLAALVRWRVAGFWYLTAFGLPLLLAAMAWLGDWAISGRPATFADAAAAEQLPEALLSWPLPAVAAMVLLLTLPGAPLGEELGWRGYALPRLQARTTPFAAGVILGMIWGAWHLPLFWMDFMPHAELSMVLFMANIVLASVLFVWMFNGSGGSVLLVMLFHGVGNTVSALAPVNYHASTVSLVTTMLLVAWLAARGRLQGRQGPA